MMDDGCDDVQEESDDIDNIKMIILFGYYSLPVISLMIPWLLPLSSAYINTSVMI